MLDELKIEVCQANRDLVSLGLVTLTWGNVSGICPERKNVVIKPSGVPYDTLQPEHMVVVSLDGEVVEGTLRPSSDTPTHITLYQAFDSIGGITHTHSRHATMFAQARQEIPCLGTTHADHFQGPIPVTRQLSEAEVRHDYESNTGHVIRERFKELDPLEIPGVLVAGHAPFTWGRTVRQSVENAQALDALAEMALGTYAISGGSVIDLEKYILEKHYQRKHGKTAYYGQR